MNDSYQEFNKFQTDFYTNINEFSCRTRYDVNKHGYTLLNNMAKGFPNLADIIMNLKGIDWSGTTSLELLKALQRKFINGYSNVRVPQFIYFKNNKQTTSKTKAEKTEDAEIVRSICNAYIMDMKTFEQLKNTKALKQTISQFKGEFRQSKNIKSKKHEKLG